MRTAVVFTCACAIGIFGIVPPSLQSATAGPEVVTLVRILSNVDQGIIATVNGSAYQIEKGFGCLSFFQYEGKQVLVSSPGRFLGAGSELILPDANQKCRIVDSKELGKWGDISLNDGVVKQGLQRAKSNECSENHSISSISRDGKTLTLDDGSAWAVEGVDALEIKLWRATESVRRCGNQIINALNGRSVTAKRFR